MYRGVMSGDSWVVSPVGRPNCTYANVTELSGYAIARNTRGTPSMVTFGSDRMFTFSLSTSKITSYIPSYNNDQYLYPGVVTIPTSRPQSGAAAVHSEATKRVDEKKEAAAFAV